MKNNNYYTNKSLETGSRAAMQGRVHKHLSGGRNQGIQARVCACVCVRVFLRIETRTFILSCISALLFFLSRQVLLKFLKLPRLKLESETPASAFQSAQLQQAWWNESLYCGFHVKMQERYSVNGMRCTC